MILKGDFMVRWVKDVDSGELFPVSDESEIEIPGHLQESEYTPIDYDKTTEMTVLQLQEQLFAAQEQIKIMTEKPKAEPIILEKKSETPVSAEYLEVDCEKVPKQHDLNKIVFIIIAVLLIGWFMVDFINTIPIETVEQTAAEVAEETEITEFKDKIFYILGKVLPFFITVSCIRLGICFIKISVDGC